MPPKEQQLPPKPRQVQQRFKIHAMQSMQEIEDEAMSAFFNLFDAMQWFAINGCGSGSRFGGRPVCCARWSQCMGHLKACPIRPCTL